MTPQQFRTLLVIEDAPDRLHIRLNRPAVRNAIDQVMVQELHTVCEALEREPRILMLSGSSGIFASGADIAELRDRRSDDALAGINSKLFVRVALLPMPVIAVLDGYALGGGAELAYAADFRIASTTLKIGNPETSLGIVAAAGATWRLAELVGEPLAKEILMAGRILNASEALAARLVTAVFESVDLDAAAQALCDRIASQDPLAITHTKRLLHAPREAHPLIDDQAQSELFESPEKMARMTAFLERRRK